MKLVNEVGRNFYIIFEKDLSQILNKFGTWAFPVLWHSCSAAIYTCTATLWLRVPRTSMSLPVFVLMTNRWLDFCVSPYLKLLQWLLCGWEARG